MILPTFDMFYAAPMSLFGTAVAGLYGLITGSFLNVVIYRLPEMERRRDANDRAMNMRLAEPYPEKFNLSVPRSACPNCARKLTIIENIPVLSFIGLLGRCWGCKTPISLRYPIIELMTAAVTAGIIWVIGTNWNALWTLAYFYTMVVVFGMVFDAIVAQRTKNKSNGKAKAG
ncbi:MAG: leader peptidase (prepilin peptidase)/N-methyltransferase [Flavobacteriaceae bacterium]|jgi:leader peptidase (prepilin peptidase)/N-methyltransferase